MSLVGFVFVIGFFTVMLRQRSPMLQPLTEVRAPCSERA
ncbi:hypothetical protein SHM7688_02369 [Shimia marina]|uniref:Uncharacterized protein n=1 Tax=Shimia marina TaxID=321267 RepID=A0A0P1FGF7_9RHOB|nr:hypothetical protein SHM7688_02369 [Shimia marina]